MRQITLAIVCVFGVSGAAYGDEALVTIHQYAWTQSIQDREPVTRLSSPATGRPVVFWTQLRASARALDVLKSEGRLPIRHRWKRYVGAVSDPDTLTPTDEITLSVGGASLLSSLTEQVSREHSFKWRTWSSKKNIRPGKWVVEVIYRDGKPVLCEQRPCRFQVEIR